MESSTTYSVVCFIDDNTVEGVPKSWIKENGTCAWPSNHNNARKMIEHKYEPNNREFKFYKIRVLGSNISEFKFRKIMKFKIHDLIYHICSYFGF